MKHTIYKLLFALCLLAGTACSQQNTEEGDMHESEATETETITTDSVSNEVPAGLESH